MSKYLAQYEDPKYFGNISDPDQNMERAVWLKGRLVPAPQRVLELGAGKFTLTEAWRKLGVQEAWGIDWSSMACRFAPDCAVRATIQDLPFRDKVFDLVTAFDILEHIPPRDLSHMIREIHRVLRGLCIANIPPRQAVLVLSDGPIDPSDQHHLAMGDRMFWETLFSQCFEVLKLNEVVPLSFVLANLFLLKPLDQPSQIEVRL